MQKQYKINKRFIQIALFCMIASIILTFFIYTTFKKSVEPEAREQIAYFRYDLERDHLIQSNDLVFEATPVSLIPKNAIRDFTEVENKRLAYNVTSRTFAVDELFVARGETRLEVEEMFQIGVNIDNISSFLGTQIREGDYYGLLYLDSTGEINEMYRVKIVNNLDSSGKIVTEGSEATIDNINIAVESEEEVRNIAEKKRTGSFELIRTSENYWNQEQVLEEEIVDRADADDENI